MNSEKKLKRWLTISLITIFSISFLTIRGETNKINDPITTSVFSPTKLISLKDKSISPNKSY